MTDEGRLQRWLASQRTAVASGPSSDHVDMETLARHAAGQLAGVKARMVSEHLLACDDGRCLAYVSAQAAALPGGVPVAPVPYVEPAADAYRPRTFQSREIVWSTFESMARELDAPVDQLVCEAMLTYARARGYVQRASPPATSSGHETLSLSATVSLGASMQQPAPRITEMAEPSASPETLEAVISPLDRSYMPPASARTPLGEDLVPTENRSAFSRPSAAPVSRREPAPESRTTPRRGSFAPGAPPGSSEAPTRRPPPLSPQAGPGGLPPAVPKRTKSSTTAAMVVPQPAPTKRLVLSYLGQSFNVDKERFLLGRSKTQADLRIDDPNVSRQHAVIERVGAAWFLVDLGSTNGVHVAGERVARRALADGDVILVIAHQIRCSLR